MKKLIDPIVLSSFHRRSLKLVHLCASLIAVLLGGCISTEGDNRRGNLNTEEPFQSLLGKRVTLLRPVHIRENSSTYDSEDIALASYNFPSASRLENYEDVEKHLVGRTLPAGTVIQFKSFSFVRPYALAWLPGQGMDIPWYPGRGLLPDPTSFYATFTSETISAIGRPFGAEIELRYRWGYGPRLWAAPWEPKDKEPVYVGDLGQSFKQTQ